MPVVHADATQAMPVEALRKRRFGMDDERNGKERKKEIRRRNADRRNK
jgi:hypothetical protein